MALFVITYDLMKQKDYTSLIDELERLGAHRTQASCWLASLTNDDAQTVVNHLSGFIDSDDKLMAIKFSTRPAFTKANQGTNNWISENVR